MKLPDVVDRAKILKIHLREKNHLISNLDLTKAATFLDGCSGAEIENLVNLVALQVVRQSRIQKRSGPVIEAKDLFEAVETFNKERH